MMATAWTNAFDGAGGILAGGALGYCFTGSGRLRGELECFYGETAHNETSAAEGRSVVAVAKLDAEVVVGQDRIGNITSHNLFGNVYFDFTSRSRITLYVGVGAGAQPRPHRAAGRRRYGWTALMIGGLVLYGFGLNLKYQF